MCTSSYFYVSALAFCIFHFSVDKLDVEDEFITYTMDIVDISFRYQIEFETEDYSIITSKGNESCSESNSVYEIYLAQKTLTHQKVLQLIIQVISYLKRAHSMGVLLCFSFHTQLPSYYSVG